MQYGMVVPDPMPMILCSGLTYRWTAAKAASRFAASICTVGGGSGVEVTVDFDTCAPAVNEGGRRALLLRAIDAPAAEVIAGRSCAARWSLEELMQARSQKAGGVLVLLYNINGPGIYG